MNFVKCRAIFVSLFKTQIVFSFYLTILLSFSLIGCGDKLHIPSAKELAEFESAGPIIPSIERDLLIRSKVGGVPLPGEVLEITMPAIWGVVTAEEPDDSKIAAPYVCRISESGTITLPVIGMITVKGKTLAEIETAIIDAYYPKYATTRPSVFVRLVEQLEQPLFTVLGLVNKPGNFPYPPDARYNIMQAMGFAGGLIQVADPRYATIYRLKSDGTIVNAVFQIAKIKGRSGLAEALSVVIKPGDIIIVEHTPRTRTNEFLDRVFRINIGTYFRLDDNNN